MLVRSVVKPLMLDEVRAALNHEGPPRPPRAMAQWHNPDTLKALGQPFRELLEAYPDDTLAAGMGLGYWNAPRDDPGYRFAFGGKRKAEGKPDFACPVIVDWSELDQFCSEFPSPDRPAAFRSIERLRRAHPNRYILVSWGHFFHQRLAYLRGIEPLLFDFVDAPDKLHVVMDRLLDLYREWAWRVAEAGANGVWGGDDLGTQRSLFMSPDMFRDLYAPYYTALAETLHENGLDFWLHTCGNITRILDDLIGCGVDALHPIQAGTMDDVSIAARGGGRIAFWVGMDVQQILPFGTPGEARAHVRERMARFGHPRGGLIVAAGNAILPDTPPENLHAYLDETLEVASTPFKQRRAANV